MDSHMRGPFLPLPTRGMSAPRIAATAVTRPSPITAMLVDAMKDSD